MTLEELRAKYATLDLDPRPICDYCLRHVDRLVVKGETRGYKDRIYDMKTRKCGDCYKASNRAACRAAYHRDKSEHRSMNAERRMAVKAVKIARYFRPENLRIYADLQEGFNVDHIMPLRGITEHGYRFSGLHVPWNLQYLTFAENMAKRNRGLEQHGLAYPDGSGLIPEKRLLRARHAPALAAQADLGVKLLRYQDIETLLNIKPATARHMVRVKKWERTLQFDDQGGCAPCLVHVPVAYLNSRHVYL